MFISGINFNQCIAQPTLIHYWHFNNTLPVDGSGGILFGQNPIYADYSITTEPAYVIYKAIILPSADTGTVDNCSGKAKNDRPGYGGCCGDIDNGIRTRNPSDNMEFLWYAPTGNFQNIIVTYATKSSSFNSGQVEQVYSYSIDGGSNFITADLPVGSYYPDTTWKKVTLNLSTVTSVNNNSNFIFRITYVGQNTGTKGNNRFDNITVEGDIITDLKNINPANYSLSPNPAGNFINLITTSEKTKLISIYNSVGKLTSVYKATGNNININTSQLGQGFYYITINENNSDNLIRLKFIKK
jgi:hypothetical protein